MKFPKAVVEKTMTDNIRKTHIKVELKIREISNSVVPEPRGSSPHSPEPALRGSSVHFVTNQRFYGGGLLAPCPTPKLEGHTLSAARNCCSLYLQLPFISGGHLLHPQPEGVPCHGDGTCLTWQDKGNTKPNRQN
jgi:hypothetical protein